MSITTPEMRKNVNLLPYHELGSAKYDKLGRDYKLTNISAPTQERMEEMNALFEAANVVCEMV